MLNVVVAQCHVILTPRETLSGSFAPLATLDASSTQTTYAEYCCQDNPLPFWLRSPS